MKTDKINTHIKEMKELLNKSIISRLITPAELCKRWEISERTLRRWREEGRDPVFLKIRQRNGRSVIRYPLHNPTPSMKGVLCVEFEYLQQAQGENNAKS